MLLKLSFFRFIGKYSTKQGKTINIYSKYNLYQPLLFSNNSKTNEIITKYDENNMYISKTAVFFHSVAKGSQFSTHYVSFILVSQN